MEHPNSQPSSKDIPDEKAGDVGADVPATNAEATTSSAKSEMPSETASETPAESSSKTSGETSGDNENTVTRPTAIERQAAAAAPRSGYGNPPPHQDAAGRPIEWRDTNLYADRRRPPPRSRAGLMSFLLLLLVAAGVALVYTTDFGRPVRKAVNTAWESAQQTVARHDPSLAIPSPAPSPDISSPDIPLPDASSPAPAPPPAINNSAPASEPPPAVASPTIDAPKTVAPKEIPELATSGPLSVPIADVSLQTRPELIAQLAQVYKSKLAADPNDLAALAGLNRLQERSLSELETMVAAGDHATTRRSLDVISRIFPEVVDTARYKYLAARTNYTPNGTKTGPATKSATPSSATPSAAIVAPVVPPPVTPSATPPVTTPITAPVKSASMPSDASAEVVKKNARDVSSSKPKIHVVSITPGAMVENQFSPRYDGNVFKVQISYRNFENIQNLSEATFVARLGIPGDPMVLGEAPVELLGGRGTKSFLMESLRPGNIGERYKLNFLLNDEYFASSTVRLSMPEQ